MAKKKNALQSDSVNRTENIFCMEAEKILGGVVGFALLQKASTNDVYMHGGWYVDMVEILFNKETENHQVQKRGLFVSKQN